METTDQNKEDIKQEVRDLLAGIDKTHQYSMSKIYGLYNLINKTNEKPQACASCLMRKTGELRKWLKEEDEKDSLDKETEVVEEKPRKERKPKNG